MRISLSKTVSAVVIFFLGTAIFLLSPKIRAEGAPIPGCPGDLNGDGVIDFSDLLKMAQNYGQSSASLGSGDLNGDGSINEADLKLLASHYSHSCPSVAFPKSMAALGDSITAGFFSLFPLIPQPGPSVGPNENFNWATGFGNFSPISNMIIRSNAEHLNEISEGLRTPFKFYGIIESNAEGTAESAPVDIYLGAKALDVLRNQLPRLHTWSLKNLNKDYPDYVTLFIGANDLCDGTTKEDFGENVSSIVLTLTTANPDIHILLVPLPESILNLNQIAGSTVTPLGRLLGLPGATCDQFWSARNICPNLTSPNSTAPLFAYNQMLELVRDYYNENHPDRVRLSDSVRSLTLSPEDLAADCFHPNFKAQERIADATWADAWWNY